MRSLFCIPALLALLHVPAAFAADPAKLDGTWEITAMIDDGEVLSARKIRDTIAKDGRLTINGQTVALVRPGTGEKKTLLFVNDPKANPATLDLAGSEKTGGKGIYILAGDTLMLCLSGPGINEQPKDFGSQEGSQTLLVTLKRVPDDKKEPAPVVPVAPVAKQTLADAEIRKLLLGSWGSQDKNKVEYFTFNEDGTFSASLTWKRSFLKNTFEEDSRSSGTWKLKDGVVIVQITASTQKDKGGQIFSYRINSISATDVIYINAEGQVRRDWKTR